MSEGRTGLGAGALELYAPQLSTSLDGQQSLKNELIWPNRPLPGLCIAFSLMAIKFCIWPIVESSLPAISPIRPTSSKRQLYISSTKELAIGSRKNRGPRIFCQATTNWTALLLAAKDCSNSSPFDGQQSNSGAELPREPVA